MRADRHAVALAADGVEVDVLTFEALLRQGTPEADEEALALFRGDLLDGLSVRDPDFGEWLQVERARLRALAEEAAGRRLAEGGAAAARKLLWLDPLREDAVRALMRHHLVQRRARAGAGALRGPAGPAAP